MYYLNRLFDNDENTVDYEQFIITEENASVLIKECIDIYYHTKLYTTIEEFLKDGYIVSDRILKVLNKYKDTTIEDRGVYEFIVEVLEENNIKVINFTEKHIFY